MAGKNSLSERTGTPRHILRRLYLSRYRSVVRHTDWYPHEDQLRRIIQGKTCTVETADIPLMCFGLELIEKKKRGKKCPRRVKT